MAFYQNHLLNFLAIPRSLLQRVASDQSGLGAWHVHGFGVTGVYTVGVEQGGFSNFIGIYLTCDLGKGQILISEIILKFQ